MMRVAARLALVVAVTASCGSPTDPPPDPAASPAPSGSTDASNTGAAPDPGAIPPGRSAAVTSVVDGDTIVVDGEERVRLIGIDTPETKDPRRPVGCFGAQAAARTAALLPPGTVVVLERDVSTTDRFGRTLAYVWRATDGRLVNLDLVAGGYAQVVTYPPDVARTEQLLAAQADARTAGRGLWGACAGPDDPGPVATSTPATTVDPTGCSPAYPTLCLPAAPDVDCGDVGERGFPVQPPDPHRLDADGNGLGCER